MVVLNICVYNYSVGILLLVYYIIYMYSLRIYEVKLYLGKI